MKILHMLFILSLSLLYADQGIRPQEIFRLIKIPGGKLLFTITTTKKPLGQLVRDIADSLGYKIKISRKFEDKLDKKRVSVFLEKRDLKNVLELLVGSAGGNVKIRKKQIIVLSREKANGIKRKISASYKKMLTVADIEEKKMAQIYFSMGTFYYLQEKYRQAFEEYDFFLQQFPENKNLPIVLLLMGDCLIHSKQYDRARQVLTRFLNEYPDSEYQDRAFIMLADCYREEAKYIESKRIYRYLLNISNTSRKPEVLYLMGEVSMVQEDYQQASDFLSQAFSQLSANSPLKPKALYKFIQCSLELKRIGSLYAGIRKFYREFPKHALVNKVKLLHVRFAFKKGNYFECHYLLKSLLKSPEIETRKEAALLDNKILKELGLNSEAIETLKKVIASVGKTDKRVYPLLYELGERYLEMKLFISAKNIFRQLADHYNDLVYLKIMECDYQAKDYNGALKAFRQYRERIADKEVLGEAFRLAANCHLKMGEVDNALEMFEGKWRE